MDQDRPIISDVLFIDRDQLIGNINAQTLSSQALTPAQLPPGGGAVTGVAVVGGGVVMDSCDPPLVNPLAAAL
jgi:hypothetical protein